MGSVVSSVGSFIGSNAGNIAKYGGQAANAIGGALGQQRAGQQQQYNPYQQQQGQSGMSSPISQAFNMMGRNSYQPSWMGGLNRRWGPGGMG